MIQRPEAPSQLPSVSEIDDYLMFLKRESQVWREFRKVVAAREDLSADDGDEFLIIAPKPELSPAE